MHILYRRLKLLYVPNLAAAALAAAKQRAGSFFFKLSIAVVGAWSRSLVMTHQWDAVVEANSKIVARS